MTPRGSAAGALATLKSLAAPRAEIERCDLCAAPLPERHDHLVAPATRALRCACLPCALLFDGGGEWRRVPERAERLSLALSDADWEALRLPIALAFFVHSSIAERVVAYYPSPAGPTESALPLDAWETLVARNPMLGSLAPDVEAVLVNRIGVRSASYRVSVSDCYALVGGIRTLWRGLGGGPEVWAHVDDFFLKLEARACPT